MSSIHAKELSQRFRGFYPVVIDIETAGFNAKRDAVLELAAALVAMDAQGWLYVDDVLHYHIEPFPGANLEASALEFTGIKPDHPFRFAISEQEALKNMFAIIRQRVLDSSCQRAVMVAHNATFDQGFLQAMVKRCHIKKDPFHAFTTFDTATLGGVALGQTVLARAVTAAGLEFDQQQAHSAKYDAERTAQLFCHIVNQWKKLAT